MRGSGIFTRTEIEDLLTQVAQSIGRGEKEIAKTLASDINGGLTKSRTNWPKEVIDFYSG